MVEFILGLCASILALGATAFIVALLGLCIYELMQ